MTSEKGIPYQRHKPSAALRQFLDPLDPGAYFDCGRARLHGLDDALLKEAESRGRTVGDDSFQLVATDMGLVFCRPSISFAIAARWEEVMLIRPHGDDPVVLPVNWPTHGELKFTVSKRLAGNVFRRWLQLRMQAARLARQEAAEQRAKDHEERSPTPSPATAASPPNASTAVDSVIEVDLVAPEAAQTAKLDTPSEAIDEIVVRADDHLPVPAESADDWELVAKVEPADRPGSDCESDTPVMERRDTEPPAKRKQLDEDGAAKRRIDRPTMLEIFEAETALPITDRPDLPDGVSITEVDAARVVAESESEPEPLVGPTLETTEPSGDPATAPDDPESPELESPDPESLDPESPEPGEVAAPVPTSVFDTGPGRGEEPIVVEPNVQPFDEHAWPVHPKRSQPDEAAESTVVPPVPLDDFERPAAVGGESAPVPQVTRDPELVLAASDNLQHASLRTVSKPETTPPSWVGSPMSLVATVVAVSSIVVVLTLAASVMRNEADPSQAAAIDGTEPAGPGSSVGRTTIDHQRFKPDTNTSVPLRSAALTPTGSSASDAAAAPNEPVPSAVDTGSAIAAEDVLGNQPRLCNSNYSGCVPDVRDVDCPGDGDGPVFAEGQAMVMGDDVYGLDTDEDGETCEADQPRADEAGQSSGAQEDVTDE